jgi:hypothetical protein
MGFVVLIGHGIRVIRAADSDERYDFDITVTLVERATASPASVRNTASSFVASFAPSHKIPASL